MIKLDDNLFYFNFLSKLDNFELNHGVPIQRHIGNQRRYSFNYPFRKDKLVGRAESTHQQRKWRYGFSHYTTGRVK